MIAAMPIVIAAASLQPSLDAVADEATAAHALDAHVICLGRALFDRRDDRRAVRIVAAEAVAHCQSQGTNLQAALIDVFRRRPERLPAGSTPEAAANAYVAGWNDRAEVVIREERARH